MTEIQKIESITKDILSGLYGSIQSAGTETQKYTYAYLQAKKIYNGDLLIDTNYTPVI
tara:strand:- start:21 stop:194 length:174 start_codon:yes stop_codon:yes gene_type:complete